MCTFIVAQKTNAFIKITATMKNYKILLRKEKAMKATKFFFGL